MASTASDETPMEVNAPIGVFDSGLGGLSVLRHIRHLLPHEDLIYFADSGFAPYGDKSEVVVAARSLAIADFLLQFHVKALVVACNTATAAAIATLRTSYPHLTLVGVEPGLKPAAALSRSRIVGILATDGTLASLKFKALRDHIASTTDVRFISQACIGLADQVERGELYSTQTGTLVRRYVTPLIDQGADTLVLGCTHYPFVRPMIEETIRRLTTQSVAIIDTGEAVARQLARLLGEHKGTNTTHNEGKVTAYTTGSHSTLQTAFGSLLKLKASVTQLDTA